MSDGRKLLVDAEAVECARRELASLKAAWQTEAVVRDGLRSVGRDPDQEAASYTRYVRALTPQPDGEAIEVPQGAQWVRLDEPLSALTPTEVRYLLEETSQANTKRDALRAALRACVAWIDGSDKSLRGCNERDAALAKAREVLGNG